MLLELKEREDFLGHKTDFKEKSILNHQSTKDIKVKINSLDKKQSHLLVSENKISQSVEIKKPHSKPNI